jgi:putative ABC transport system ATP-binding protein
LGRVLEIRELRKTFRAEPVGVHAIRSASLTVEDGEYVAIMGPSGCGKSTLLNVAAGLLAPSGGDVVLAGESLAGRSEDELAALRRVHIGIVFQFFHLIEGMTALENVVLAALIAGVDRRVADRRAHEVITMLGLEGRSHLLPSGLSGGQRQRLAIARALANKPALLLADEPTGALDSVGAAEIMELFDRLNRDGQTIMLVTHDEDVAATAGRIVRMRDGRIGDPVREITPYLVGEM